MPSYLGIDASLEGTGLCLVTVAGFAIRLQTISPDKLRGAARLLEIKRNAELFIPADVEFAAIEGYAYDAVGRVFELGEVGGVLRLLVHERNIPYVDVPPASLKKFATGRAGAKKAHMIEAAEQAGARPVDDNQADAFHLARVALACCRRGAPIEQFQLRRSQMEVVHQILHPTPKKPRRRARRIVKNAV